jgi:hypothetical protein
MDVDGLRPTARRDDAPLELGRARDVFVEIGACRIRVLVRGRFLRRRRGGDRPDEEQRSERG